MTRHLAIPSSTPRDSVMLLFYCHAMEQTIRKRQQQRHSRYPFLLFPAGSRIFALLMFIWSFHLASDRSKRSHRVARYLHLVLMVKVERQKWLTIRIPRSRVTDDIRLKNETLSPSARIAAADLVARSPLQFNARASKEILLGSKHGWAHSRRLVDCRLPALGWIKALKPPFKPGGFQVILPCLQGSLPTSLLVSCFRTRIKFTRFRWMCILLE